MCVRGCVREREGGSLRVPACVSVRACAADVPRSSSPSSASASTPSVRPRRSTRRPCEYSPRTQRVLVEGCRCAKLTKGPMGRSAGGGRPQGNSWGTQECSGGTQARGTQGVLRQGVLWVLTGYSGKGHALGTEPRGTQGTQGYALLLRVQVNERAELEDLRLEPLQSTT